MSGPLDLGQLRRMAMLLEHAGPTLTHPDLALRSVALELITVAQEADRIGSDDTALLDALDALDAKLGTWTVES